MFCGNCGAKLNGDERCCPNCGAKTRIGQQEEALQEHPVEVETVNIPEQEAKIGASTEKPKRKGAPRKKFFAGAIAVALVVIVLVMIFSGNGGSESGYADGLIEADNIYGLSTTVTVDEFINYYNEALCEYEGIALDPNDGFFLTVGGLVKENLTTSSFDDGTTFYHWQQLMGSKDMGLSFWTDSETGYIIQARVSFDYNSYVNTDTALAKRFSMIQEMMYAFCGGNSDASDELMNVLMDCIESNTSQYWNHGISMISGFDDNGYIVVSVGTVTEEIYNDLVSDMPSGN